MHKNKETTWSLKLRLDMWVLNQKKKKKEEGKGKKNTNRKKNLNLCTCKHHTLPLSQNQKEIIQSFTLVYKEKPGFSLQFPGRYRSRNKSNTIIIVITITILQSTTNEKNTGNGCYHILIADFCCTYKKISHNFFFFTSKFFYFFFLCVSEHVRVYMCVLHFSLWRVALLSDKQKWTELCY